MPEPLNYDDNGITGLFCSHSEVVFRRFQNKKLSARGFSLWHFFPSLLFSSTCFLIHFHYNTAFCFVNIFSATASRLKMSTLNSTFFHIFIVLPFCTIRSLFYCIFSLLDNAIARLPLLPASHAPYFRSYASCFTSSLNSSPAE